MIFEKLILRNFGVYRGTHEIALEPSSPDKPIILFGGLNGCGKTTILDAIQLALYGPHARCSNRERMAYADFLAECTSRGVAAGTSSGVELWLRTMESDGETHYRIERSWGPGSKVEEALSVRRNGHLDPLVTSRWDEHVEEMLPVSLAPLFFFDGEKIQSLADLDRSSSAIREALHALLGLGVVDQLVADLKVIERRHRSEAEIWDGHAELRELERGKGELDEQKLNLAQETASLRTRIDTCENELGKLGERLRNEGGQHFESRAELERQRDEAVRRRMALRACMLELASGEAPLLLVRDRLERLRVDAAAESRAALARALADELKSRDSWLVEQLASSEAPLELPERVKALLERDRAERRLAASMPQVTGLSPHDLGLLGHLIDTDLPEVAKAIAATLAEAAEADEEWTRADRLIAALPPEERIKGLLDQRLEQTTLRDGLKAQLSRSEAEFQQVMRSAGAAKARIDKLLTEFVGSKDTQRILAHSSRAREALGAFRVALISKHLQQIESLAFDSFSQLMRKKRLVERISIDPETYRIELFDRSNAPIPAKRLSAGERQLLAIGLLWGIARTSGRPVPVAIDTPLGRLDSSHRINLVDSYFPNVSHQVLLLSTDEEIDEAHLKRLRCHLGRTYFLRHDEESQGTVVESGYFWEH